MTMKSYIIGFISSLALTLIAYFIVVMGEVSGLTLILLLAGLALVQMIVQLNYFLHLGAEAKPRYRLASFIFMAVILFIVVAGSVWIMHHLDSNMMNMTPDAKDDYMKSQFDKGF
jgi:cytochrome o ubiquinol oxidase subunit IV